MKWLGHRALFLVLTLISTFAFGKGEISVSSSNQYIQRGYFNSNVDNRAIYFEIINPQNTTGPVMEISMGKREISEWWKPLTDGLTREGAGMIFLINHRGWGRSGSLHATRDNVITVGQMQDYLSDMEQFYQQIIYPRIGDRPINMVSHSVGSLIGLLHVLQHQERYERTFGLGSFFGLHRRSSIISPGFTEIMAKVACATGCGGIPIPTGHKTRYSGHLKDILTMEIAQGLYKDSIDLHWLQEVLKGTTELFANINDLLIPSQFYAGTRDGISDTRATERIVCQNGACKIIYVKAGHSPHYDEEVANFLSRDIMDLTLNRPRALDVRGSKVIETGTCGPGLTLHPI